MFTAWNVAQTQIQLLLVTNITAFSLGLCFGTVCWYEISDDKDRKKICVGLSFNISDCIFTHWGICCFTTIQLYTTGCFFLLTMSLFLLKCEKRNYNTNVLKLACFCTLMRIFASEQLTQIPMSHCSYEPSQAEQHQIVSGMISSSYVTLVSKHWRSLAVWYHLCLDGYCKGEGCRLYLKANVL